MFLMTKEMSKFPFPTYQKQGRTIELSDVKNTKLQKNSPITFY